MKRKLLSASLLALCLAFSAFAQVQQEQLQTSAQRSKVNAHKEQLVRGGMPYEAAVKRALTVFENEQEVSSRNRLIPRPTRNRLPVPPAASIWVNRDPANPANPHPVYDAATAEDLVKDVLLSDPAAHSRITNVSFTGTALNTTDRSLAYFSNGDGMGIPSGLILSTYQAQEAEAPNLYSGGLGGGSASLYGDLHLTPIAAPYSANAGSILQFDFQPYTSKISFDFIFASEEYPEFSNSLYNDAFGFFVFEQGDPTNFINIALFPDGSPVTINDSNWGNTGSNSPSGLPAPLTGSYPALAINPEWHVPNYEDRYVGSDSLMEYDGRTIKLQAVAENLDPSKTYTLKLAICNVSDDGLGSAVFLANLDLGRAEGDVGGPDTGVSVAEIDALGLNDEGNPMFIYGNRPCTYPMELTFDEIAASTHAIIDINYISGPGTVFPKSALRSLEGEQLFSVDTIQLNGLQDMILQYKFKLSTDFDGFVNGQYAGMTVSVRGTNTVDTVFYAQLYNELSWNVDYRMMTEIDKGYLDLGVTGGTPHAHRSLNGGLTWKPISAGFSSQELLYIGETCDILLYQPFQCCYDTVKIRKNTGTLEIQHYVDILGESGVITEPAARKHYVKGNNDFSFTAKYAGDPLRVQAKGYYSKILLDLDKTAELQLDGSYKYTIYKVAEPWTISFTPQPNSDQVSNEALLLRSVWSSGNTLYMNVQTPCIANIYTLTGLLYKQVEADGNTAVQLPQGFYIVSVNGKQYKVMIK